MKGRSTALIVLAIFLVSALYYSGMAFSIPQKSGRAIKIGVDINIPPYSYMVNNEPTGFNIDMLKAMEKYTNITFEFVPGTWNSLIYKLKMGQIDALMAMVPTKERNRTFFFTQIYQHIYFNFFQRATMAPVKSINDIANHTIAVVKNDITENFALEWMNKTHRNLYIVEVNTPQEGLELVNSNSVDLFLYEIHTCTYYISKMNLKNVVLTNIQAFSMPLAIAVKKSEPWLVNDLNMAINKIKESGEYTEIYNKWFNPQTSTGIPLYIYGLALILGISLSTIGYMGVRYVRERRRVREQDRRIENLQKLSNTLMENMPIGLLYIKEDKCIYANPEALKILGYSFREINSTKIFRKLIRGGEIEIKTKSGHIRWVLSKSINYGHGKIVSLIDITERKILQIKEEKRFEFLNNMLDALRNPVQNMIFASEDMESKDMQEIIKKEIEKIANILKEEPK